MTDPTPSLTAKIDWLGAASLVARMLVWVGVAVAVLGFTRTGIVVFETNRGAEALATIESAAPRLGGGALIKLSWREASGATWRAQSVEISRALARKLNLGRVLSRTQVRIRHRPDSFFRFIVPPVVAVDDIPEHVKSAASLAVAGFLALSAGSAIMLGLLLLNGGALPAFGFATARLRGDHQR
jgi:hypothetical protein